MPAPCALLLESALDLEHGPVPCRVLRGRGRRLVIRITPEPVVEVRVPRGVRLDHALAWVESRRAWLERARLRMAAYPAPLRFRSGEVHHVRGVPLKLRAQRGSARVELQPGALVVRTPDPGDPAEVEDALRAYYRQLALEDIPARVRALARLMPGRAQPAGVRVRLMRRRWGTCRHDGLLTFSTLLARAAPAEVDYVIVHELCHLRHFHHGPLFHALLQRVLPDWNARRRRLERLPPWPAREALACD